MALVFKDRVRVTSTTTGTGTITLGSAVSGFQDFSVIGNGNTTYYSITDQAGNWEVGIGTYTASGTTLSRDTILESSNSGSVVDFPAGIKTIFVTYPAEKSVYSDASGNVTLTGAFTPSGGISNGATFNKTGTGGEGGELHLEKGATSTLSGDVVIDAYNQSVRIFENGGTNRGAQFDISAQAAGVGSTILTTASTIGIANGGTGQTTSENAINALMPSQTGNTGKFLKTDGSAVSWDTPSGGSSAKSWTYFTASGTYTVPTGVSSIRAYAIGKGGDGVASATNSNAVGGGGGGFAFGDIAVTAGQSVTITINGSGVATVAYGGTTLLTANNGNVGSGTTPGTGGTASKHASVTNGGAYSGGAGGGGLNGPGGGGSSGSPLGNGYAGGTVNNGGGGGGGIGGSGATAGGGAGGGAYNNKPGGSGGGGDSVLSGLGRGFVARFTDPLIANCIFPGATPTTAQETNIPSPGGGGASSSQSSMASYGGPGGDFAGGGSATSSGTGASANGGSGGICGGGGSGYGSGANASRGGSGGYGGGGGGAANSGGAGARTAGSGGAAIVLIYA